jgi:hypothetical protein
VIDGFGSRLNSWIKSFLATRGIDAPTGKPLYTYRCRVQELQDLEAVLRFEVDRIDTVRLPTLAGPGLCLYAAEWWRRNHEGGSWAWAGIKKGAGIERYAEHQLYPALAEGMRFWQRELLRNLHGRLFLVTLACEGGLPLKLVHRQKATLGRYFRQVLEDVDALGRRGYAADELAAGRANLLPVSLRQDVVYRLVGELAERILELQSIVGDSKAPVSTLDEHHPDWRDDLPLVVEDDVARNLLSRLVEDATALRHHEPARIRFVRSLVRTPEGWQLVGELSLPSRLTAEQISTMLPGIPMTEFPGTAELYLGDPDRGGEILASLTRLYGGEASTYRVEPGLRVRQRQLEEDAAREQLVFIATAKATSPLAFSGTSALGELPWIFGVGEDEGVMPFEGQGSISTRKVSAVVALPSGYGWDTDAKEIGTCCGRRLVKISEEGVFCSASGDVVRVRTCQKHDHAFEYRVRGQQLEEAINPTPIFRGLPGLFRFPSDGAFPSQRVGEASFRWKPRAAHGGWRAVDEDCLGEITLRILDGEAIAHQENLQIVPKDLRVVLEPGVTLGEGRILLEGIRGARIIAEPITGYGFDFLRQGDSGIEIRTRSDRSQSSNPPRRGSGDLPLAVSLELHWPRSSTLELHFPYPARGARFIGRDEAVLKDESEVRVDEIGGVRAMAVSIGDERFFLEGVLLNGTHSESVGWLWQDLRKNKFGRYELSLRMLRRELQRVLSATCELDATVRLAVTSQHNMQPCRLLVKRFDAVLEPDRETCSVVLRCGDPSPLTTVRTIAIPLWEPGADEEELARIEEYRWAFPLEDRRSGPWLLLSFAGSRCCARPLLWTVYTDSSSPDGTLNSVQAAVLVDDFHARTSAIDQAIEGLVRKPMGSEWTTVQSFLQWLAKVPPATFDVPVRLARNPAAAVLALLRSESKSAMVSVRRALEDLPFSWQLVGATCWRRAFASWFRSLEEALVSIDGGEQLARDEARASLVRLAEELTELNPLMAWLSRSVLLEEPPFIDNFAGAPTRLVQEQLQQALVFNLQALNQRCEGRTWPEFAGPWARRWEYELRPFAQRYLPRFTADGFPRWKRPAMVSPVAAALAVAIGQDSIGEAEVFDLRRFKAFDDHWTDHAYELTLALVLGQMQEPIPAMEAAR